VDVSANRPSFLFFWVLFFEKKILIAFFCIFLFFVFLCFFGFVFFSAFLSCHTQQHSQFFSHPGCAILPLGGPWACLTIFRNLLNSNISSTCHRNMVNFGPLTAGIGWQVWGTPANFNRFHLGFLTAPTSLNIGQPNFVRCLAVSWASILYIHFLGLLSPNGILPGAKFSLQPSLAFSYIGSSPILATLLHGTRALGVSQTLRHGTRNGITELSLIVIFASRSENPLMEFRQLENSLQVKKLEQMRLTTSLSSHNCQALYTLAL